MLEETNKMVELSSSLFDFAPNSALKANGHARFTFAGMG